MRRKIAVTIGCAVLALAALAASPGGGGAPPFGGISGAQAAVSKSLGQGGGGGDVSGAFDRLGDLLSGGAVVVIAVAGYLLLGALVSRNIGTSVAIVLVTLGSLIFLLSPQSIESLAKGIANTVF